MSLYFTIILGLHFLKVMQASITFKYSRYLSSTLKPATGGRQGAALAQRGGGKQLKPRPKAVAGEAGSGPDPGPKGGGGYGPGPGLKR